MGNEIVGPTQPETATLNIGTSETFYIAPGTQIRLIPGGTSELEIIANENGLRTLAGILLNIAYLKQPGMHSLGEILSLPEMPSFTIKCTEKGNKETGPDQTMTVVTLDQDGNFNYLEGHRIKLQEPTETHQGFTIEANAAGLETLAGLVMNAATVGDTIHIDDKRSGGFSGNALFTISLAEENTQPAQS